MAMSYSDSIVSIKNNNWFRIRVEEATSVYSNYLLNTVAEDPDYDAKIQAGTNLARSSMQVVDTLMFTLSGDQEVIAAGPAIPEAELQMIVEKTINKLFPIQTVGPAGQFQPKYLPNRLEQTKQ